MATSVNAGARLDFLPDTASVRSSDWRVAAPPARSGFSIFGTLGSDGRARAFFDDEVFFNLSAANFNQNRLQTGPLIRCSMGAYRTRRAVSRPHELFWG